MGLFCRCCTGEYDRLAHRGFCQACLDEHGPIVAEKDGEGDPACAVWRWVSHVRWAAMLLDPEPEPKPRPSLEALRKTASYEP